MRGTLEAIADNLSHPQSEKAHQYQLDGERKTQRQLEDRLEAKEKELKREVDRFAVESAFRVRISPP